MSIFTSSTYECFHYRHRPNKGDKRYSYDKSGDLIEIVVKKVEEDRNDVWEAEFDKYFLCCVGTHKTKEAAREKMKTFAHGYGESIQKEIERLGEQLNFINHLKQNL